MKCQAQLVHNKKPVEFAIVKIKIKRMLSPFIHKIFILFDEKWASDITTLTEINSVLLNIEPFENLS